MIEAFGKICVDINNASLLVYETQKRAGNIFPVLHSHTYYEVHYSDKENVFCFPNGDIKVKAGSFLIINPGESHYALTNSDGYVIALSIEKKTGKSKSYEYFKNLLDNAALKPIEAGDELSESIHRFREIKYGNGHINELENIVWASEFLRMLFLKIENSDEKMRKIIKKETEFDEISVALEVFVNNLFMSVEEMAEKLNYSERHISRLIKQKYGMPLKKVRTIRMIETAKWLMSHEELSLKEVAEKSGFSSFKIFSQKFKQYVGCTPKEYRNELNK